MNLGQLRRWWHGRYHTTRRRPAKEAGPSRQGTVEELVAKTDKQGNPKQQRSRQETCANLEDWRPQPPSMCVCDRDARKLRAYGKSVRHQVFPGRDSKIVSPFVVGQHQSAPLSSSNFSRNYDFNFMSANVFAVPEPRESGCARGASPEPGTGVLVVRDASSICVADPQYTHVASRSRVGQYLATGHQQGVCEN